VPYRNGLLEPMHRTGSGYSCHHDAGTAERLRLVTSMVSEPPQSKVARLLADNVVPVTRSTFAKVRRSVQQRGNHDYGSLRPIILATVPQQACCLTLLHYVQHFSHLGNLKRCTGALV